MISTSQNGYVSEQLIYHRVSSDAPSFQILVKELDAFLASFDGSDHSLYSGFNRLDSMTSAVVALSDNQPVACGAIRLLGGELGEIKRMYVQPKYRNRGIAAGVLRELEDWAFENGVRRLQLETGAELPNARRLYERSGYQYIPNYEPYIGLDRSVCMAKDL